MNKRVSIAVLIITLAILLPASLSAQEEERERERKLRLPDKRFGLIVNFTGLASDLIAEYVDGGQDDPDHAGGLGMKLWPGEKSAVRVLLDFEHQNVSGTTDTWFGVGGAYEYHLLQRRVSPYLGGLAGLEIQTGTASNFHVYFGAMLGAEFELVENLNLYGEYNLLVSIDEPVFSVDLELGNHAQIGIIVYLN